MEEDNKIVVRCRAIIFKDDQLLVVKHSVGTDYYVLPGGHLEQGENIKDCMEREIMEELGLRPRIGRLLYINNLIKDGEQNIEFFFEIVNASDYLDINSLGGTHKHELAEICWIGKNDTKKIRPVVVQEDLNSGSILSGVVKFIELNK